LVLWEVLLWAALLAAPVGADDVSEPVAEAEALAGVVLAAPEAVEQATVVGRSVTPKALQSCGEREEIDHVSLAVDVAVAVASAPRERKLTLAAAEMAVVWSSALQSPARQQAISPRKSLFLQMHSAFLPQSPMPPFRKVVAQFCCREAPMLANALL
jgi:hypothetical protein